MRGTIVRIGVLGAGSVLAVGLLAAPSAGAASGKQSEKSGTACFTAAGKTQGRSHSDPDGMSNGGADKPGCPGGFDADKDGNNGCGNDADREDDNNGNCGRKPARDKTTSTSTSTSSTTTTTTTTTLGDTARTAGSGTTDVGTVAVNTDVAATTAGANAGSSGPAVQANVVTAGEPQTQVLGETLERPSALARTGAGVGGLALLGGLLCGGGRLAILARRFLRID